MMIRALWTGATGMHAQQKQIDTVAHDLSNVNTRGYKKTQMTFADLFYQRMRAAGLPGVQGNNVPSGLQIGNGTRVTGTHKVFTMGGAQETGVSSNMLIQDDGNFARNFFPVVMDNEGTVGFTRDGSFARDAQGNLVLPTGAVLQGVTLPAGAAVQDITVTFDGRVMYNDENGEQQEAGQFQLATFANPAGLEPQGDNIFLPTQTSGDAQYGVPGSAGFGQIKGGWVENSNVSAIEEMVKMITAQRSYEFNSRSIQTSDQMLQTVNNLKR